MLTQPGEIIGTIKKQRLSLDEKEKLTLSPLPIGLLPRRKIRPIESDAKCHYLKKFTCKGTLGQVFIFLGPPHLLGFCLGWSSNFVGSESSQIQSVQILQNMVQQDSTPPTPSQSHTVCIMYIFLYFDTGKGEREENKRESERGLIKRSQNFLTDKASYRLFVSVPKLHKPVVTLQVHGV